MRENLFLTRPPISVEQDVEAFQSPGGNPINIPMLSIEARKKQHQATLRKCSRKFVAPHIQTLTHRTDKIEYGTSR
ncbi:MAG: hypothetical protein WB424_05975 [Terracidiphilus sp.]